MLVFQAEVTFRTEADAKAAMAKHRQNMGSRLLQKKILVQKKTIIKFFRYIELFYEGGY